MNKKTKNTYEAAFYLLYGASLDFVVRRPLGENTKRKKGYAYQYTFHLKDVPLFALRGWTNDVCYGDIKQFERARRKLKRYMQ